MNIWLFQTGEALPLQDGIRKMRTAILADKLAERGHNILWWASAFDHFKKDWLYRKDTKFKVKDNFEIFLLKGLGYKKNVSLSRYLDHRRIAKKFKKISPTMRKPDAMIASFPSHDLAYEAVVFAQKNAIPMILDVRDQWPDIFFEYLPQVIHPIAKYFLRKDYRMVEYSLKNATSIVTMMNDLLEWALNKTERDKTDYEKVFFLGTKKLDLSQVKANERLHDLKKRINNRFVVSFIGTFGEYYNPEILVRVAKQSTKENMFFVLCGDGKYFNQISRTSKELENVYLTGWATEREMAYVLSLSSVGVVPSTRPLRAFPNKAFTYLSAGLPIISSVEGDLKEAIEKYTIGLYYPPSDIDALKKNTERLFKNPSLHKKMSENANRVFDEMFDADKIYTEYADHVEKVLDDYVNKRKN